MKIILHIGFHKTGSTSIQNTLARVRQPGFRYLCDVPANHSLLTRRAYRSTDHEVVAGARDEFRRLLAAAAAGFDGTLIISAENLSALTQAGFEAIHADLSDLTPDIRVIGYVRPIADFMASSFQQRLKDLFRPLPMLEARPFETQIAALDSVFGRENVDLVPFDRALLHGKDVVKDFCHRIGMALDPAQIVRSNESLGLEAIALLYAYRQNHDPAATARVKRQLAALPFIDALRSVGDTKFAFDGSVVEAIYGADVDALRRVSDRIGYSFDKFYVTSGKGLHGTADLLPLALSPDFQRKVLPKLTKRPLERPLDQVALAALLEGLRVELTETVESGRSQATGLIGKLTGQARRLFRGV